MHKFVSPRAVGLASLPATLGLVGDLGQTNDSAVVVRHLQEDTDIIAMLHVGDLSCEWAPTVSSRNCLQ